MSPHEPEDSDGDWVKRYREASDVEAAMPSAATREAILAEGRRITAARAAQPTVHQFDPRQRAANQPRWRLAAAGTVGAALFAAVLMYPHLATPPNQTSSEMASAPAAGPVPMKPSAPSEAVTDALKNEAITAERQAPAPPAAQRLSRKALPAPSQDAAPLARSDESALRESQNADRTLFGAQSARTPNAAAPAVSMGLTARSNVSGTLLSSVASGDLTRLSALLNEGADPQQVDSLGQTPLLLAVIAHREDMVQLLLAHHADPNIADHLGHTPLQRARLAGVSHIARLLEEAGAR